MSVLEARAAERAWQWETADTLYEEAISAGDQSLETLLDAAVFYWQSTDGGLSDARYFSEEFRERSGRRPGELLAEAIRRYPTSTAARFWQRYIWFIEGIDSRENFGVDEARRLLDEDPSELVPVLRIVMTHGHEHELPIEASELFRQSHAAGTARGRYVAGVISSALIRSGAWLKLTTKVPLPTEVTATDWTSVRFEQTEQAPGFECRLVWASRALWRGPWVTLYFWPADAPGHVEIGRKFELLRDDVVVAHGFVH